MNDVLARASAISDLISSGAFRSASQPVAEALLSCCADLVANGEPHVAIALVGTAAEVLASSDPTFSLRLGIVHVRALTLTGEFEASQSLLAKLANEYPSPDRDSSYRLRIAEASNLWGLNRADDAISRLEVVRAELLMFPDSYLLGWCAYQLASAETVRGEHEKARRFVLEAIVSARRCGSRDLEASSLLTFSLLERAPCRWSGAREAADAALLISRVDNNAVSECHALRVLAIIAWKRGDLDSALQLVDEYGQKATILKNGRLEWFGVLLKGMIRLHCGDFEGARELFSAGIKWVVPESQTRPSLLTTEFLGDIHLEQGDAKNALKYFDDVWPRALALLPKGDIVAELRRRIAECLYLMDDFEKAYAEARIGLLHCRELGDRYEEAATYRILAISSAALGRQSEAKQWFDQGFAYYDDIETPYEWGKLWLAYGDWLASDHSAEFHDDRGAVEAYRAACDHFERGSAKARVAEVEARLAKYDSTSSRALARLAEDPKAGKLLRHPQRRPRGSVELDRKSQWSIDQFGLVTRDRAMLRMLEDVEKLARSTAPVLVLGESGTGKELVAHGLHRLSGRSGSFVPINCAALPREIIESELFGHVAGAFTGATRDKPGLLEVCSGGTVFLDEIAEMGIELQSRLLRFLETGEVRRVGATRAVSVQTRVVAATNRDRAALERGEGFRTDLYYRLAHAVIELPPLRRRADDVELLIDKFLEQVCTEEGKRVTISVEARSRLKAYTWPGNVRQLKSAIRRVVILASSDHEVRQGDLQLDDGQAPTTLLEELEQAERRRISDAMRSARGSRTEAARSLGMPRTTLINKLKRFGLF